jgi:hypothetical protein
MSAVNGIIKGQKVLRREIVNPFYIGFLSAFNFNYRTWIGVFITPESGRI